MPTYVLMTRLAPDSLHDAKGRRSVGKAWMDKVHRLAAEERRNPTIRPGAEQVIVTYRGYGEDFSVELRPTGHPTSPFVGLLRYSELLYTCTEPKASDCTVASSVPVTEIFRLRDGHWSY